MSNRLVRSTSPYLQQHADNPVDWYPWGEEAFAAARERDVPVFLSVGYSACHWCHVMAHESFEDPATAETMNAAFVCVKVDREERPDVDAIYMSATQAMTGQGGWPMSVVLTPTGEPFFAGTYYPPEPRHGMPSFRQVLDAVSEAWRDRRTEVESVGADLVRHLRATTQVAADDGSGADDDFAALGEHAVRSLVSTFDERHAGFGGAPKFPPSMLCEFLLRRAGRTGDREALRMAEATLEAMARGGIYDQLGGGFARYSVDDRWDVPHFEKMLYDNALLLSCYLHWGRLTGSTLADRVARETADFLLRELATVEGGFASALDADSDGQEGAYYVWTPAELRDVLGDELGTTMADVFQVSVRGNAERGTSTLRLPSDAADIAAHRDAVRRLLQARALRPRPGRDDKVVAAWNGLAITALAEGGVLLEDERYLSAAVEAARLLVDVHLGADDRLRRVSRDGVAGEPDGVLEDYACVAEGFLTLFAATGDAQWFDHAERLVAQVRDRFGDGEAAFYDTAADAEQLVARPRDPTDNATPSGQATVASVLATMSGLTGEASSREGAEALVRGVGRIARQAPRFAGKALSVVEALADGPRQVAVVGRTGSPARGELVAAAFRLTHPGVVIAQGDGERAAVPLLEARPLVNGEAAAYVCHDFVCDLPVTDPAHLAASAPSDASDHPDSSDTARGALP
ncbi:MAG: thioredoxin domain-containing protein [Nocardioidaceae bacterium]